MYIYIRLYIIHTYILNEIFIWPDGQIADGHLTKEDAKSWFYSYQHIKYHMASKQAEWQVSPSTGVISPINGRSQ